MEALLTQAEITKVFSGDEAALDPDGYVDWWIEHGIEYEGLVSLAVLATKWAIEKEPEEDDEMLVPFLFLTGVRLGVLLAGEVRERREST